ncbi:MAG: hypothetical protein JWQ95_2101 [Sphaerisporangium sp.]|nr:hypothetical protein [Sphaerisporangium sp.]
MPAPRKSTDRYRSMAHYFGALVRDLRDSYELRVGEPLAVTQLSARLGYSPSMLGSIGAKASPSPAYASRPSTTLYTRTGS